MLIVKKTLAHETNNVHVENKMKDFKVFDLIPKCSTYVVNQLSSLTIKYKI